MAVGNTEFVHVQRACRSTHLEAVAPCPVALPAVDPGRHVCSTIRLSGGSLLAGLHTPAQPFSKTWLVDSDPSCLQLRCQVSKRWNWPATDPGMVSRTCMATDR